MKLACRFCGKVLTQDLRPLCGDSEIEAEAKRRQYPDYAWSKALGPMPVGSYLERHLEQQDEVVLDVDRESTGEGVVPEYRSGCGCCDWGFGKPLKCTDCGETVAELWLDCHEPNVVRFYEGSVDWVC